MTQVTHTGVDAETIARHAGIMHATQAATLGHVRDPEALAAWKRNQLDPSRLGWLAAIAERAAQACKPIPVGVLAAAALGQSGSLAPWLAELDRAESETRGGSDLSRPGSA